MMNLPQIAIGVPVVLGALAVYWLMPRAKPYPLLWGACVAGFALLATGWYLLRTRVFTAETLLFYAFSMLAILAGGLLVTQRNPARAALSFALVVLSTCGLFLLLAAPFLMAATIIIYAGAIIVTFLFIIMLAQQEGQSDADQRSREPMLATIGGFVLLGAVVYMIHSSYDTTEMDSFAERMAATYRRLEVLNERSTSGEARPSRDEMEAVLKELEDLRREGQETVEAADRWVKPMKSGPLVERDVNDGTPNPLLKQFYEAAVNAAVPLAICKGDLAKNQDVPLDRLMEPMGELNERTQELKMEAPHLSCFLQPHVDSIAKDSTMVAPAPELSDLSGTAADRPVHEMRRDAHRTPQMPAENVAALGKSLFTDYLLDVELAGTLLLVATIGAIAIAMRRAERGA